MMTNEQYEKYLLSVISDPKQGRYQKEVAARELFKMELRRKA